MPQSNPTKRIADALENEPRRAAQLDPATGKPVKQPAPIPESLLRLDEIGNFKTHIEHAQACVKRLEIVRETMDAKLKAEAETVERSLAKSGLPRAERRKIVEKTVAEKRRELLAESEDGRLSTLREMQAATDRLNSFRWAFESPQAMLGPIGLGDPKRSAIEQSLLDAGPQTIRNMALRAVAWATGCWQPPFSTSLMEWTRTSVPSARRIWPTA